MHSDTTALEDAHEGFGSPPIAVRLVRLRLDHPALVVEVVRMFASAYFRFGLNIARGARARHAVMTTRHQEREGWAAASASRLSRRRSFFFVPTTERLPPAGLVDPSLPLRPARVHGVGEAVVLDPVLTAGIALLKLLHL